MYKKYQEQNDKLNSQIKKIFQNNTRYYVICDNSKKYINEVCEMFPNIIVKKYYNHIYLKNGILIVFTSNNIGARPLIKIPDLIKLLINFSRLDYEKYILYFKHLCHIERQRNTELICTLENPYLIEKDKTIKAWIKAKNILVNLEEWLEDMTKVELLKDGGIGFVSSINPKIILDKIKEYREEK